MTSQKKRFPRLLYLLTALVCLAMAGVSLWSNNIQVPTDSLPTPDELSLSPASYAENVVIPYNIAPLNVRIENKAFDYITCITSTKGEPIVIKGKDVRMSENLWRNLLESNKGNALLVTVYVKRDGVWFHFPSVRYQIAPEPIDPWVVYRISEPAFTNMGEMKLVQRDLESFKEKELISVRRTTNSKQKELSYSLFPTFHPSLPIIAGTVDHLGKDVPFMNDETETTFKDGASVYLSSIDEAMQNRPSMLKKHPEVIEAFPFWSKDGKSVYTSIAVKGSGSPTSTTRNTLCFNLIRRSFRASDLSTGPADTLINASQLGKSAVTPQLSPDGNYLLFCLSDNGNKPLWHKSSDLYVMNLSNGAWNPMSIANSDDVDNQPVWSSNGRWILFGSNRLDGTYTRLYIAYFDTNGLIHKPFILPQRNPSYDKYAFKSFNSPTFLSKPNTTSQLRMMAYLLDVFDNR